jgi:hypothetical protein
LISVPRAGSHPAPFDRDDPHLARDNELAAAAAGYLTYTGPYSVVDDGLVAHHVELSPLPKNSAHPNRS